MSEGGVKRVRSFRHTQEAKFLVEEIKSRRRRCLSVSTVFDLQCLFQKRCAGVNMRGICMSEIIIPYDLLEKSEFSQPRFKP